MGLTGTGHQTTLAQDCLTRNEWICGRYLESRGDLILDALREHLLITVISLVAGFLLALPLAVLVHRFEPLQLPIMGSTTLLYTVPSLAMFSLLLPVTGLSPATVIIGLTLYSLTILVRGISAGLADVPPEARDAAVGLGYGPMRLLWKVELPLALPALFAGLRIAAVSTIALATIGTIVGYGGLGDLLSSGLTSLFKAQVLVASVLCVLLAFAADAVLLGLQKVMTPWARGKVA